MTPANDETTSSHHNRPTVTPTTRTSDRPTAPPAPEHLRINDRIQPVDIEPGTTPTLRWRMPLDACGQATDDEPSTETLHYEAQVLDIRTLTVLWACSQAPLQPGERLQLHGLDMQPGRRYLARVRAKRTVDGDTLLSPWSVPMAFGTGAGTQWHGTPIWIPDTAVTHAVKRDAGIAATVDSPDFGRLKESTSQAGDAFFAGEEHAADPHNSRGWAFLRHEFTLRNQHIVWATLNVTAASVKPARQFVHRTWVNGTFVGLGPTFPIGDEARYDGWDVTGLLHPGRRNAIGALAYTVEDQRYAAQLDVCYADGSTEHIVTDGNWTTLPGSAIYPDSASIGTQYFEAPAENIRSGAFPRGFSRPGFDDSAWVAAEAKPAFARLLATPTDKVAVRYHAPVSMHLTEDGHLIADFGHAVMGGIRIGFRGNAACDLKIRYGEVCEDDGSVKYRLSAFNVYEDTWRREADVPSLETWGLRVFRYVEIIPSKEYAEQARRLLDGADTLDAAAIEYPFDDDAAMFDCSDDTLATVWSFCRTTVTSLNGPIYADSWTRERAAYEADAWLQQRAHLALDDAPTLGEYTIDYLTANRTWPTEWPLYLILAVHDAWMATGSTHQIMQGYDRIAALLPDRYLDKDSGLIVKDPGQSSVTDGDLVDWPPSERDGFVFGRVNTVINALASQAYADMADIADVAGHPDDARRCRSIAARMRNAIHELLFDEQTGAYADGLDTGAQGSKLSHCSLHASAFALAFADVPPERVNRVADYLRGRGMACSVYTAAVYLDGLYRAGYGADANHLIASHEPLRSWMNMIATGAGATMEAWDLRLKGNTTYSHPWASSPAFLLEQGLLGVRPTKPGYREFDVRPQLGDLTKGEALVPSPAGSIHVLVERDDAAQSGWRIELTVPVGTRAHVDIAGMTRTFGPGRHTMD